MMDRNTLLAFFLIALVLIFTPKYMELVAPTQPRPEDIPPTGYTEKQSELPGVVTPANNADSLIKPQEAAIALPLFEENLTILESDLYRAVISSAGGGTILSFSFNNYFDQDSQPVDIINKLGAQNLGINFKNLDGDMVDLSIPWENESSFSGGLITKPVNIKYSHTLASGKKILKSLTFYPDSYVIDVEINTEGVSDQVFAGLYSLGWGGGLQSTEENIDDDLFYFNSFVYQGGELVDLKVKQGEQGYELLNGATDWAAVRTKYFIAALIPSIPTDVAAATMGGFYNEKEVYSVSLSLPSSKTSSVSIYLGPLEYERIKLIGRDLEMVMNFGWSFIRPISKAVLFVLKKMHEHIPNYGYILILFAVGVKLIVYPLTKKSYQSTAAMQKIQPELMALRDKFKNNPQKLQQAQMQLYKEKGVNPLGGCLPMLLQMPLLFALFQVFRTTIELRSEPFIWWIKDLSAPDTIFTLPFTIPIYGAHVAVLPVLMVVSMFIQQRMMTGGAAQQPQQKMIQYFMTGFFFLIFNSFPSGLNLYYTLFNVLTIAQQKLIPPPDNTAS